MLAQLPLPIRWKGIKSGELQNQILNWHPELAALQHLGLLTNRPSQR